MYENTIDSLSADTTNQHKKKHPRRGGKGGGGLTETKSRKTISLENHAPKSMGWRGHQKGVIHCDATHMPPTLRALEFVSLMNFGELTLCCGGSSKGPMER